ncbi:hypothetical protein DFJ77DRAFT_424689, partial [Powellomyces hirtus]
DPNRLYCICRQPLATHTTTTHTTPPQDDFFIGCEGCDEWFHGRCVNVTQHDARGIESWMCTACELR